MMSKSKLGLPDMSHRCTCVTDAICQLHPHPSIGLGDGLWKQQAYERIIALESQLVSAYSEESTKQLYAQWESDANTELESLRTSHKTDLESAQKLARALAKKHFPDAPQFKVLDDIDGVISQIDNMTCALSELPVWVLCVDRLPSDYGRYFVKYRHESIIKVFVADWDYPEKGGMWANQIGDTEIIAWRDEVFMIETIPEKQDG